MQSFPTQQEQITYYDKFFEAYSRNNTRVAGLAKFFTPFFGASESVLEVGCGIGVTSMWLISAGYDLVGVDFSHTAIERCKDEVITRTKDRILASFVCADILDFECDRKFDLITMFDFLEHLPQPLHQKLFDKVKGWMHRDSRIFISVPDPVYLDSIRLTTVLQPVDQSLYKPYLLKLFQDNGFRSVVSDGADVYKYYILENDANG